MSDSTDAVKHSLGPDAVKHGSGSGPGAVKHIPGSSAVKHAGGTDSTGTRYQLAEADAQRMKLLSAEIAGRLDEMGKIFTATVGTPASLSGFTPQYVPQTTAQADVTYVEIICTPAGCGCYVTLSDGTGFCEFPCGG